MAFGKSFPRRTDKTVYPRWEDVTLTPEEERAAEKEGNEENSRLMKECLDDARAILAESHLKPYQADITRIAAALFDKRASHLVWWKERKCKDKFDAVHDMHEKR